MPYISKERRYYLGEVIEALKPLTIRPGDVAYLISHITNNTIEKYGTDFTQLSQIVGELEASKLEIYRRIVSPYEEFKKEANGDVLANAQYLVERGGK